MITTPLGFSATEEEAVDPDFWQAALLADSGVRIYPWPDFVNFTDQSEATVYENTPQAVMVVRDGRYNFKFDVKENLCLHKAMYTHRAISGRVFFFDDSNQLLGTSDADGNFKGFSVMLLNTEKLTLSNGTVSTKSPIVVVLRDNLELDRNGALLDASFINDLARLTDVTITLVSQVAAKIVVAIAATCDGTPLNGLALADFVLTQTDGTPQVITAVAEDDGTYTLTKGSGSWVDGFLDLVAPADLTIEAYESTGPLTINIP